MPERPEVAEAVEIVKPAAVVGAVAASDGLALLADGCRGRNDGGAFFRLLVACDEEQTGRMSLAICCVLPASMVE